MSTNQHPADGSSPAAARIEEIKHELTTVSKQLQTWKNTESEARKHMLNGHVLHELQEAKVHLADEFLECALRNDKDGQKAIFSKALEADKKERDFKETHGLASLEKRYDKLTLRLVEAQGKTEALQILEEDALQIEHLHGILDKAHPTPMQIIIHRSVDAERKVIEHRRDCLDKTKSRDDRSASKGLMRQAEALVFLYCLSQTGEAYYKAREHLKPYARFLLEKHPEVFATSEVAYVRRLGGVHDDPVDHLPVPVVPELEALDLDLQRKRVERSIGHLSLRQRDIYFGRRGGYSRW